MCLFKCVVIAIVLLGFRSGNVLIFSAPDGLTVDPDKI